jgi:hypothetical protein
VDPRARSFGKEENILSLSRYPGSLSGSVQLIFVDDLEYRKYTVHGKWSGTSGTKKGTAACLGVTEFSTRTQKRERVLIFQH